MTSTKLKNAVAICAAAASIAIVSGAAQAATYNYDFKSAANAGGGIGESIYSEFNTSSFFAGPNLKVTASKSDDDDPDAFVYFDNGNAGMGVCGDPLGTATVNVATNGGANACDPGSDDGITTTTETLHFEATDKVRITSFSINSNHDSDSILDTVWDIGGIIFDVSVMNPAIDTSGVTPGGSSEGDIVISVDFLLEVGDVLKFSGVEGPNSYISAIGVSAVPIPAAGLLLLAGLGGLGAMRARKKSS